MIGRSAEITQASTFQRHGKPDAGTGIERLRFRVFKLQAAAFDEADTQSSSRKFPRDGNSGGARADHADIRLDGKPARVVPKIFDHARAPCSRWRSAQRRASARASSQPSTTTT